MSECSLISRSYFTVENHQRHLLCNNNRVKIIFITNIFERMIIDVLEERLTHQIEVLFWRESKDYNQAIKKE